MERHPVGMRGPGVTHYDELGNRLRETTRQNYEPIDQILRNQETIMSALSLLSEVLEDFSKEKARRSA